MECPDCKAVMTEMALAGHVGTSVTIDVCLPCHLIWFDGRESLQLTPASTLRVFRLIGEQAAGPRQTLESRPTCPRCELTLKPVHDMQRTTRFSYWRCLRGHGRLITFFDFLREKNFLRPMTPAQIEDLRRNIDTVNCSNCGAAIDLVKHSACAHCGSALSVLDANQAGQLVAELRAADRSGQGVDPALPLRLERARREAETAFGSEQDADWYRDVSSTGLVEAGLRSFARWISRVE